MAAGGLPIPTDDSVKSTVLAALEMQQFIINRKAAVEAQALSPSGGGQGEVKGAFEMRVGIHTGPVVAGIVGVKKFQYDIWGDTVNIAARMESNSQPGRINVSENTYTEIKDQFTCAFRGEINVKNKGMMRMYFVEAELAATAESTDFQESETD
jgi:class 3 adenylate cyclase